MAVQPLSSATHPGLGGPLPRQLADATQGHPPARLAPPFTAPPCGDGRHPALAGVSARYSGPGGRFPTCYSPVRHWARDCSPAPSDLHVLGTPPAFILSQDRTLKVVLIRAGICRHPKLSSVCVLVFLSVCFKTLVEWYFCPYASKLSWNDEFHVCFGWSSRSVFKERSYASHSRGATEMISSSTNECQQKNCEFLETPSVIFCM